MTSKNKLKDKIKKLEKGLKALRRRVEAIQTNYTGMSYILFSMVGIYDKNMTMIQRTFEGIAKRFFEPDINEEDSKEETDAETDTETDTKTDTDS